MKCFHCNKKIEHELRMKHIGDGDFVCDKHCETAFKKARKHFLDVTVHSAEKTERWLLGEDD